MRGLVRGKQPRLLESFGYQLRAEEIPLFIVFHCLQLTGPLASQALPPKYQVPQGYVVAVAQGRLHEGLHTLEEGLISLILQVTYKDTTCGVIRLLSLTDYRSPCGTGGILTI
jgi:hypothetical protein